MTPGQAQQGNPVMLPQGSAMKPDMTIPSCPIDLADNNSFADGPPLALFAQLREQAPVVWNPPGVDAEGFWSLTTYEHVAEVNKDWQRFSSARKGSFLTEGGILPREFTSLVFNMMDPPEHDRH